MTDDTSNHHVNELNIEGEGIGLRVTGDAAFVFDTYLAVRAQLMSRFVASQTRRRSDQPSATSKAKPPPIPKDPDGPTFAKVAPSDAYAWVCVCHDFYRKIHIIERHALSKSVINNVVDQRALFRVFVEREHKDQLLGLVGPTRELWSELTSDGQRRLNDGEGV